MEWIQHTFDGQPPTAAPDPTAARGGGAQIGLITLRTSDLAQDMQTCTDQLGMRYLSRQAITDLGFDLYFFALTDEHPPIDDVNAVGNREWLWQRPYTSLEFQHLLEGPTVRPATSEPAEVLIDGPGPKQIGFL